MDINNYPNYLIYSDGRVWSKKRNIFLKSSKVGAGYLKVALDKKDKYIHRLVAEHYIPNPDNLNEVDHKNRDKTDNRVENLRWTTRQSNMNNTSIQINNKSGFQWISKSKNGYTFQRSYNKVRIRKYSQDLSKVLCYSFFYLLKLRKF